MKKEMLPPSDQMEPVPPGKLAPGVVFDASDSVHWMFKSKRGMIMARADHPMISDIPVYDSWNCRGNKWWAQIEGTRKVIMVCFPPLSDPQYPKLYWRK